MFYVIMGVSGSGKSTIGQILSDRTGWTFYDADDFHPQANIDKMNRGIPLTDRDRAPWLQNLQQLITNTLQKHQQGILACSALKAEYRRILSNNHPDVVFIYLRGDYDSIQARIKQRQGHFMKENLLRSQFETLEEPECALTFDVTLEPEAIVSAILSNMTEQ
jgi:gluconokinase